MKPAGNAGLEIKAKRSIGVDLGRVRCGVAIDDELGRMAHARPNLDGRDPKKLTAALIALAEAEGAARFVIGLPLHMDGREGEGSRRARVFADRLAAESGREVLLWDERLSTVEAARALQASGLDAREAKSRIDGAAATVILQGYLDRRRLRREAKRREAGQR